MDPADPLDCGPSSAPNYTAESSPFWRQKIEAILKNHGSNVQQGPLQPSEAFGNTEAVSAFFSGHQMRKDRLRDRERYASWAIHEALKDFPSNTYQITGDFLREKTASDDQSGSSVSGDILKAIAVDDQQHIDAEDANVEDSDAKPIKTRGLAGAAHALLAASHNSLGPPIQPCVRYLRLQPCGSYGRRKMTVWRNPELFPRLTNENGSKGLLDTQATGVVHLLSRLLGKLPKLDKNETPADEKNRSKLRGPRYCGAILADSMGLRKTLTVVALLDLMVGQGLNIVRRKRNQQHRPMLLLAPNLTVTMQWVEELLQSSSHIKKIIVSGGCERDFKTVLSDVRVKYLTKGEFDNWPGSVKAWSTSKKGASEMILVMPIGTWCARTSARKAGGEWSKAIAKGERKFSIVVVDEAHCLETLTTATFKSVFQLQKEWTILITATPCLDTLTDLFALAHILWTTPSQRLKSQRPESWDELQKIVKKPQDLDLLQKVGAGEDLHLAAGRPALLAKLLCKDARLRQCNIGRIRAYLRHFENLAIIRRGPGSCIPQDWDNKLEPVCLEGLLPNVRYATVTIHQDAELAAAYQMTHIQLLTNLTHKMNALSSAKRFAVKNQGAEQPSSEEKPETIPTLHRLFKIASSSLDVYRLDRLLSANGFGTRTEHVQIMRNADLTFQQLGQFLLKADGPKPRTALGWLKIAVRRSPILRYILHYLKEHILNREERGKIRKLLITEDWPILAYFYELTLQLLGIDCRVLHAGLKQWERKQLIDSFNKDEDNSCQVLIQMYNVGFAGTNLHKNCQRVLVAAQAHSLPVQSQAIHRIIRVGQEQDVEVHRLRLSNSFHVFQETRQVEKSLPELGARAHGPMIKVLLQLLNDFQYEVEEAWKSEAATRLLREQSLMYDLEQTPSSNDPALRDTNDGHVDKRRHLSNGRFLSVRGEDHRSRHDAASMRSGSAVPSRSLTDSQPAEHNIATDAEEAIGKRAWDSSTNSSIPGDQGWFDESKAYDSTPFISLRTRSMYYEEFKRLPPITRSRFSHEKNQLRRLLSYRHREGDPGIWTEEDLNDPAVLERALELVLRLRLGVNRIEVLPIPHIDFSLVSKDLRDLLQTSLGALNKTDQDIQMDDEKPENQSQDALGELLGRAVKNEDLGVVERKIDAKLGPAPKLQTGDVDDCHDPISDNRLQATAREASEAGEPSSDSSDSDADSDSKHEGTDSEGTEEDESGIDETSDNAKGDKELLNGPAPEAEGARTSILAESDNRHEDGSKSSDSLDVPKTARDKKMEVEAHHDTGPSIKPDPDDTSPTEHPTTSRRIKQEPPETQFKSDHETETVSARPVERAH